jgi:hypothetical protein
MSDLILDGNRQERTELGELHWTNHSLMILTCTNFTLTKVRSDNAADDGFFLDSHAAPVGEPSSHTLLKNKNENGIFMECSANNSYRNGMSCDFAWNIQIIGGFFTNSNGTPPEGGIDVEPDADMASPAIQNILIKGVSFTGNREFGLILPYVAGAHDITVDGCYFNANNYNGFTALAADVTIKNCVFYAQQANTGDGAAVLWVRSTASNCVVTGNTIANIKNAKYCIRIENSMAKVTNNKIYDFTGIGIEPAGFSAGNDIQPAKIIADPGLPPLNVISINSPASVSAPTSGKFGYKVKYLNLTNVASVSFTWLKKPSWVTVQIDSAFGTAPATPGIDTLKVVATAGTSSDTLAVVISISYYKVLEAETGTLVSPMVIVADPAASGGNCISAPGGNNTIVKNIEASYTVANMPAGNYYVWLKMSIPTGNLSNNYGALIGFGTSLYPTTMLKPKVENAYAWVRSATSFALAAGTNTFIMGHSLALAKIDQIVITTSWEATIPEDVIKTSLDEKQTQNRKLNLSVPGIIPQPLSGGRINFVVSGISSGDFTMDVFNIAGSRVWSYHKQSAEASEYQIRWDGTDSKLRQVQSGIYIAKMRNGNQSGKVLVSLIKR